MFCLALQKVGDANGQGAGDGIDLAITEEELDGILDRERVFASSTTQWGDGKQWSNHEGVETGDVLPLPREGQMYDVVDDLDSNGGLSAMA